MCSSSKCKKCGKITYHGCGNHLKKVFRGCTKEQICLCKPTDKLKKYLTTLTNKNK